MSTDPRANDGTDTPPVERATRIARLAKILVTTLAALVGIARAFGWL